MIDFETDIENCLQALRKGRCILYPTDTIWGLGCDATNDAAINRVFDIKQRPANRSVLVLIADPRDIIRYVANPDPAVFNFLESCVRPTTIIYDSGLDLAAGIISADGSIGIRVVNDSFCNHLIRRFRKPIVSTSANLSGASFSGTFNDIDPQIVSAVDYVVKYRQDDATPAAPSTIVRSRGNGKFDILRP